MTRCWNSFVRKAGPLLGAGLLLQVGSCAVDPNAVVGGLVTTVLNNLITSVVFGAFNVPLSGF